MKIRLNLLPQFNNTLFVRIDDPKIVKYIKNEKYTELYNDKDEIVGYNIENFEVVGSGKIEVTDEILHQINAITNNNLTHDYETYLYVGEIIKCEPHPNSQHLKVCHVQCDELLQIVCGAANAKENLRVVVAKEHAIVNDMYIKKGKLLNVESQGMLCSAYELGLIKEYKKGLLELDTTYQVGSKFEWKGEKHV